jgi:hypothetical protein
MDCSCWVASGWTWKGKLPYLLSVGSSLKVLFHFVLMLEHPNFTEKVFEQKNDFLLHSKYLGSYSYIKSHHHWIINLVVYVCMYVCMCLSSLCIFWWLWLCFILFVDVMLLVKIETGKICFMKLLFKIMSLIIHVNTYSISHFIMISVMLISALHIVNWNEGSTSQSISQFVTH